MPFSAIFSLFLQTKRIQNDGYPASDHKVITTDGYILQLHRIANETSSESNVTRTPVFLMHGLLETASSWIALGPDHSLGIYTALPFSNRAISVIVFILFLFELSLR